MVRCPGILRLAFLLVPSGSHALRVVWDKEPNQPYVFPIRLTLRDQDGQILKFSDSTGNGIRQFIMHLDGPVQDPTYYHVRVSRGFASGQRAALHGCAV